MKNTKKTLSLLLAAALFVALFCSFSVFAAGGVTEEDDDIDVPFLPTKVLTHIQIEKLPNKLAYLRGEPLETPGLMVKAYYSDMSTKTVWSFTASGHNPNALGKQRITISFEGKTAAFDITVLAPGDANADSVVDGKDATLLLQYAAGWDVDIAAIAADVNNDDAIDGKDATLLLQYAAGWNVSLGQ